MESSKNRAGRPWRRSGYCHSTLRLFLLMTPGAYHQIIERGEDTERMHRFTTRIMCVALLPFALGLGIDAFVATEKIIGVAPDITAGLAALLFSLSFWYGIEAVSRGRRDPIEGKGAAEVFKQSLPNGPSTVFLPSPTDDIIKLLLK